MYLLAGTGSRSCPATIHATLCDKLDKMLKWNPQAEVLSGAATGFDHQLALAAYEVGVPYHLCIPNRGYASHYWKDRWDEWVFMSENAITIEYVMEEVYHLSDIYLWVNGKKIHSNFVRNSRMVERANGFHVYDAGSPGTKHCVEEIRKAGKPMTVIAAPCNICGEPSVMIDDLGGSYCAKCSMFAFDD